MAGAGGQNPRAGRQAATARVRGLPVGKFSFNSLCQVPADWARHEEALNAGLADIEGHTEILEIVKADLDKLMKRSKKGVEKEKSRLRYQIEKHVKAFQGNGCSAFIAKLGSRLLFYQQKPPSERPSDENHITEFNKVFAAGDIGVWDSENSPLADVFKALDAPVNEKVQKLQRKLASQEGKGARGYYVRLDPDQMDGAREKVAKLHDSLGEVENPADAYGPFALTFRKMTMRLGESAIPFCGMGGFLQARTSVAVACLEIEEIMAGASAPMTSLSKLAKCLDELKPGALAIPFVVLSPGDTMFVPPGIVPVMTGDEAYNSVLYLPWLVRKHWDVLEENVADCIGGSVLKHAKNHKEKEPWDSVVDPLEEFLKAKTSTE